MGKYRFRLSDMMPNAWFYKLKDMGKSRSTSSKSRVSKSVNQSSPTAKQTTSKGSSITKFQHPKSSYVYYPSSASPAEPLIRFTDPLYSSPRNHGRASDVRSSTSLFRNIKRATIYQQKNENFSSFDQPFYYSLSSSELNSPEIMVSKTNDHSRKSIEFGAELLMFDELGSWSSPSLRSSCSCSCRISSSTADIIIDLNHHHHHNNHEDSITRKFQKLNEFDALSELELRPILTKIPKEQYSGKINTELIKKSASKEVLPLGHNNSKFVGKVNKSRRSSSLSDSFAIVKSSVDPQRDFQDSMMEMIEENNIRGFKDLEELLACYLSLNCKEYHPLIIKAFEQIWLDIFCCS